MRDYYISNELKQMYKANTRPRTEEMFKIMETRIKRKEEQSETKVEKQGRREEKANF